MAKKQRYLNGTIFYRFNGRKLEPWVQQVNGVQAGPFASLEDAQAALDSSNDPDNFDLIGSLEMRKVKLNEQPDGTTQCESFCMAEETPFDVYGLYGRTTDGYLLHLADYDRYAAVRNQYALLIDRLGNGPVDYRELLEAVQ